MKLRNKKTGEIREIKNILIDEMFNVNSLSELNEEWEDYKEPKEHWCINEFGTPEMAGRFNRENIYDKSRKLIGNDFGTREEAEKAVKKIEAWKRLKDKGFKFIGVKGLEFAIVFDIPKPYNHVAFDEYEATEDQKEFYNDLMLLFGGEDE